MAQKSAAVLQSPSPNGIDNCDGTNCDSNETIQTENNGVSVEGCGNNDLSIFQDTSFHSKGTPGFVSGTTTCDNNNNHSNGLFGGDENMHSVKTRMKQSLARRRTALRARNLNVRQDEGGEGSDAKYMLNKKKNLAASLLVPSESTKQITTTKEGSGIANLGNDQDGTTNVIIENIDSAQNNTEKTVEQNSPLTMEDVASVGEISLELDSQEETGASNVVDSIEENISSDTVSQANESKSAMNIEGLTLQEHIDSNCISLGSYENQEKEIEEASLCLPVQDEISSNRNICETEEKDVESSQVCENSGICTEDGELISVADSCASVTSTSSSQCDEDGETASSSSSPVHSGITTASYTDSIKTFSIGGRSVHMDLSTGRFRSIFSPSGSCSADEVSLMGSYGSVSGGTVIPDEAISPNSDSLSTSPEPSKRPSHQESYSEEENAQSSLDDLTRKLDEVRSEKKESSMKMAQSALQAKTLLEIYDNVSDKSKTPQKLNSSHVISPVSKLLAVGIDDSKDGDSFGLSKSAAASLIERNKTLIKEVRFADQTCVELSEKNLAMEREMRATKETVQELKVEKESLHEAVIRSSQASGRMEESYNEIKLKLEEERRRFKRDLESAKADLEEVKDQNKCLTEKLDKSNKDKVELEKEAVSACSKYDAIREEYDEAKETVSTLMGRLSAAHSASEVSASAAAHEYRDACREMQRNIDDLKSVSEERQTALDLERKARREVEEELHDIRCMYESLQSSRQSGSPLNTRMGTFSGELVSEANNSSSPCSSQTSSKTSASTVLAKTLHEELKRGHDATIRIIEAEKIISVTQSKLRESERNLQATRKENARLLRKCKGVLDDRSLGDSFYSDDSFDDDNICGIESDHISQKLASARTQCEEYKTELNAIIDQIRGLQSGSSSPSNSRQAQESLKMLEAVQDLAQVCTRVNSVAGNRVTELEGRIQYLAESMNHLNQICAEDISMCSASSTRENVSSEEGSVQSASFSILDSASTGERTSLKMTRLSNELELAKEELSAVGDEKVALEKTLSEARRQVEYLTSHTNRASLSPNGVKSLQEEKYYLEQSVLDFKDQVDEFERKIEVLEEDKAYLFDDIDVRSVELNEANGKILSLEKDINDLNGVLNQLAGEKEVLEDKLENLESLYVKEKDMWRSKNCKIENEMSGYEERIQSLSNKVELLSQDVIEANNEKENCIQLAAEEANKLKYSYMNCNERLAEITEINSKLESTIAILQKDLNEREAELDAKAALIEEMSNEYIDVKNKLSDADAAVDSTREELVIMASKVEELSDLNEECEAEWKKEQELRQMEVGAISAELNDTKSLLDENKMELSSTLSSLQATRCELNQFKKEYREQCQVIRAKDDTQTALQRDFDTVERRFNELQGKSQKQVQELHSKATEVSSLNAEIERIQLSYNELEVKSSELVKEAKSETLAKMNEVARMQENIHILKHQIEKKSQAKDSAVSELSKLRRKNESMNRKCNRMREYVKNLTQKCKEWENTYSDKDNLSKAYEEKYAEAIAKIQRLTSESSPNDV